MKPGQATVLFSVTLLVGGARLFAYSGMPLGQELSLAAVVHYLALHAMTFALGTLIVAALSRGTATRAAQVAWYAQAALFLAPFVDIGLGLSLQTYDSTYTGILGGSPGSIVAAVAYAGVLAWGAWDASLGPTQARTLHAFVAVSVGVVGLSVASVPWPQVFLERLPWGLHIVLAAYFGLLAVLIVHTAIRFANPGLHRRMWKEVQPLANVGFALLPLVGIVAAGRLALPPNPIDPLQRLRIEAPFMVGAVSVAALLFVQWRLVRSEAWTPLQREAAVVAKASALAGALLLGIGPFLAAGLAGSLLWFARSRWNPLVFGAVAGLAVLVGDITSAALNFASVSIGPTIFYVPIDQNAGPSLAGIGLAAAVGVLVAVGSRLTSRTSASGRGRASS